MKKNLIAVAVAGCIIFIMVSCSKEIPQKPEGGSSLSSAKPVMATGGNMSYAANSITYSTNLTPPTLCYPYAIATPTMSGNTASRALVIHLHGAGERGKADSTLFNQVTSSGAIKLLKTGTAPDALTEAISVHPRLPVNNDWDTTKLNALLMYLLNTYPVIDPSRVYVTGLSLGGGGALRWALSSSGRLAAMLVASQSQYPGYAFNYPALKYFPIWFHHNSGDPVIPVSYITGNTSSIRGWVIRLAALWAPGSDTVHKVTIYPKNVHDAWTDMFNNPAVWSWLFSKRNVALIPRRTEVTVGENDPAPVAQFETGWSRSTSPNGYLGYHRFCTVGGASAIFRPVVTAPGRYALQVWWTRGTNRSNTVAVLLNNQQVATINEQINGSAFATVATIDILTTPPEIRIPSIAGSVVTVAAVRLVPE